MFINLECNWRIFLVSDVEYILKWAIKNIFTSVWLVSLSVLRMNFNLETVSKKFSLYFEVYKIKIKIKSSCIVDK